MRRRRKELRTKLKDLVQQAEALRPELEAHTEYECWDKIKIVAVDWRRVVDKLCYAMTAALLVMLAFILLSCFTDVDLDNGILISGIVGFTLWFLCLMIKAYTSCDDEENEILRLMPIRKDVADVEEELREFRELLREYEIEKAALQDLLTKFENLRSVIEEKLDGSLTIHEVLDNFHAEIELPGEISLNPKIEPEAYIETVMVLVALCQDDGDKLRLVREFEGRITEGGVKNDMERS